MLYCGDHMVETYSCMGLVMDLYVARIVSLCFKSMAYALPDVEPPTEASAQ